MLFVCLLDIVLIDTCSLFIVLLRHRKVQTILSPSLLLVWKLPKLWVGFLKCVSQTQPRSFPVLLQLPPLELESALNKHADLKSPLASFASQLNLSSSLPRLVGELVLANLLYLFSMSVSHPN
ncbi:hypothetical protein G4B88_007897 [Cannabis sativa]|uniref:Symplekin C-terminal domain-containing protein n=1 Tax=Cannabis sativa TaxID=3483 RepID=A0A7J6EJM3_CANSA|nr:hypothetical protein G4B88_007897 [Cannabis sativa]